MAFINLCLRVRSIISEAKQTGQSDFAENPKSINKQNGPFANKPEKRKWPSTHPTHFHRQGHLPWSLCTFYLLTCQKGLPQATHVFVRVMSVER